MTEPENPARQNLYSRSIRGGVWVSISRFVLQLMNFARFFILAKLLPPREFGILAIAMLSFEILEIFTQTGFFAALVQKKEKVEEFIHSAWTVSAVRGVMLFVVLFWCSPYIVRFFDNPGHFKPMDILQARVLADKITDDPNVLNQYMFNSFSESARQELKASSDLSDRRLELLLTDELNALCQKDVLYSPNRFQNITLSAYAVSEVKSAHSPSSRLNRLLLEEAFPQQIKMRVLNVPQMTIIMRMVAALFLIYGLNNSKLFLLTRNLQFDKTFYLQSIQTVLGFSVTVSLAFWLRNVWALVWGQLTGAVIGNILGYIILPYRPRLDGNLNKIRQLWKFGRHITGVDILGFLAARGDSFFIGKMLGMASMGHYAYACKLSYLIPDEIEMIIGKISFPTFSQIQDCIDKIRNGYHKSLRLINVICFPVAGLLLVLTPLIVVKLLNEKWMATCPIIQVLSLTALLRGLGQSRSVFLGLNRPDIQTRVVIVRCILLFSLIYPLTQRFGAVGGAIAVVGSMFVTVLFILYYTNKLIRSGYLEFIKLAAAPFVSMLGMTGGLVCLKLLLTEQTWFCLISLLVSGLILYCVLLFIIDKYFNACAIRFILRDMMTAVWKKDPAQ